MKDEHRGHCYLAAAVEAVVGALVHINWIVIETYFDLGKQNATQL